MQYYVQTDETGRLIAAGTGNGAMEGGVMMDMPEAFSLEGIRRWRIVDGTAVYEPMAQNVDNEPTQDDRLSALEEAMLGLLIGGTM